MRWCIVAGPALDCAFLEVCILFAEESANDHNWGLVSSTRIDRGFRKLVGSFSKACVNYIYGFSSKILTKYIVIEHDHVSFRHRQVLKYLRFNSPCFATHKIT